MALFVSSGDQTLAPLVITGLIGATVNYTLKSGTKSVSGTGVIGARRQVLDPRRRLDAPGRHRDGLGDPDAQRADERRRVDDAW